MTSGIRQRQLAGRPRKSGERNASGDLKRPTFEQKRAVDEAAKRPRTSEERAERIERIVAEAKADMFPKRYCGKHLAGINCVYFINQVNTRIYKIGYSQDLRKRVDSMAVGTSMELNPVAWVSVSDPALLREMERQAQNHASLIGEHMRGEWFKLEPAYISVIVGGLEYAFRDHVIGVAIDQFHEEYAVLQMVRDQDEAGLSANGGSPGG